MAFKVLLISVLFNLICYIAAYQRFEFILEFSVKSNNNHNYGTAHSQTHITSVDSNGELCFTFIEDVQSPIAIFQTTVASPTPDTFLATGNITFPNHGVLFINSPLPGKAFKSKGVQYGAIPYNITGGTGVFGGAVGSASDIFVAFDGISKFKVILLAIFYLPKGSVNRLDVESAFKQNTSKILDQATKNCVHPDVKINGLTWNAMITKFTSTPNGNKNDAYAKNLMSYLQVHLGIQ